MTADIPEKAVEAAIDAFENADGIFNDCMRAALAAALPHLPQGDGWRDIASAPSGQELLLYEPEEKAGRNVFPARMVVGRWPTHYPRKASHWQPLPPSPSSAEDDHA